jgi:hypothetical protein
VGIGRDLNPLIGSTDLAHCDQIKHLIQGSEVGVWGLGIGVSGLGLGFEVFGLRV